MQISPISSIIDFKHFDHRTGRSVYRLNENKLPKNECHIIFPLGHMCKEQILLVALEYLSFHPETPLNEKFNIHLVKCGKNGDLPLTWCSFPVEFAGVCKRIAAHYELTLTNQSRAIANQSTLLEMPRADNILIFQRNELAFYEHPDESVEIERECQAAKDLGDWLNRLGVD